MNWTTLYINGRTGFREEVGKRLEDSSVNIMPGYENGLSSDGQDMYWLAEGIPLRDVKEAIGAKLIWKYRLRFNFDFEEAKNKGQENLIKLSKSEEQLMKDMRKRMKHVA